MKQTVLTFALLLLIVPGCSRQKEPQKKTLGEYTLSGGEERPINLNATSKTKVGWSVVGSLSQTENCPNHFCATLYSMDDLQELKSWYGGTMAFDPTDGKLRLRIKNLSDSPLNVKVYVEK